MIAVRKSAFALVGAGFLLVAPEPLRADVTTICVSCSQPDQKYVCQVETPGVSLNNKALHLFCIVRTAKDGGHKSCAISRETGAACDGPLRTYIVDRSLVPGAVPPAPGQPPENTPAPETADLPEQPAPKDGPPKTLLEMTSRAGEKVRDVAGDTGRTLGKLGKKAGERVGQTAQDAGSVAKKTGSVIGNAARFTYRCARSLFRNCRASEEEQ